MMSAEKHEERSHAYGAMEAQVLDLSRMAKATALILDLYMEEKNDSASGGVFTNQQLVKHLAPWSDAVDFMVHQLSEMAQDLRRHYA